MSMSHATTHTYHTGFDKFYALLTDEEFLRAKYEGIGSRNVRFSECRQDGKVFRIKCSREVRANPPAFARKFIAEWNKLDETTEWVIKADGTAHADYVAVTHGVPGVLKGAFDLRSEGSGCVEDIVMNATVPIPMVGKKIAALVESESAEALAKEYAFSRGELGES
jgi:hypothetical protein